MTSLIGNPELALGLQGAKNMTTEKDIVRRAYELWEKAGKPEGRDDEFYHLAEQELRNENKSSPVRTPDNL
jgi:hypothetical protein